MMKKTAYLLLLFCALAMVASCQKDPSPDQPVAPAAIDVTEIRLDASSLTLAQGAEAILTATVLPANATDKSLTWSSSNPSVAKVEGGKVSALSVGSARISASNGNVQAHCEVTVMKGISVQWGSFASTDNAVINGAGGSEEVLLTTDGDWTISVSGDAASWLSVSPSSGGAGETRVTITSSQNTTRANRTGTIVVNPGTKDNSFTVKQRAYVYSIYSSASSKVSNSLIVKYSGNPFNRIYSVLPAPRSGLYQEISNLTTDGTQHESQNNGNLYLISDLTSGNIPASGQAVLSSSFDLKTNSVTVNTSLIDDIPEADLSLEPYKLYLGDEEGDYVSPSNKDIAALANTLWTEAGGKQIDYAKRCFDWTARSLTYGNAYTGLHTITELMRTKKGDCGNFSSVFISLLRAKGIPARHLVMIEPGQGEYHVRADFYIPGYGWIPADPTFQNSNPSANYFGRFSGNYAVMSLGIDSLVEAPEDPHFIVVLLQSYLCWYWTSQSSAQISFEHKFSKGK